MISKPILRIGSVSSTTGDNPHAMARMVQHGNVDVIIGDWLSEMKIAWDAIVKQQNHDLGYERGMSFEKQLRMYLERRYVFNNFSDGRHVVFVPISLQQRGNRS
ncbi:hypothetical protein Z517_07641 [Fonsecaea pedrosoi CBS 271.37]|uniref:Acyclic terpene utilisation N-terminal domain-containing protein n=1 Tax=Fonsecaea pedrosoi CBS 271.37 TaxID=1442368 RepID=A0A0D2GAZ4_9EURO|nr:uncharacterized protein Z517_07641 [Fonsecaea pedrosoi CBS 271.37]KIW77808.1 hypothetical protein Z517_07641 [Fonsecaea pedrosoi CBS 271.37]